MKYLLLLIVFLLSNCRYYNIRQKVFINAKGSEKLLVQDAIDEINTSLGCDFIIYEDGLGLPKKSDDKSVIFFENDVFDIENNSVIGFTLKYPTTSYDDIEINRTRINQGDLSYSDKKSIIQHEVGHMLGFNHEEKWNSIMATRLVKHEWMSKDSVVEGWADFISSIKSSFPEMCRDK